MAIGAGVRDVAKHATVTIAAGPASTAVCGNNPSRVELILQNIGAADMWVAFATSYDGTAGLGAPVAPTAATDVGFKLATGATFVTKSYTGPVAVIGTAGQKMAVTEL